MKTYYCTEFVGTDNMTDFAKSQLWRVCKAEEAEARIEQLEKALKSCLEVLERQRSSVNHYNVAAGDAIGEAHKALRVTER